LAAGAGTGAGAGAGAEEAPCTHDRLWNALLRTARCRGGLPPLLLAYFGGAPLHWFARPAAARRETARLLCERALGGGPVQCLAPLMAHAYGVGSSEWEQEKEPPGGGGGAVVALPITGRLPVVSVEVIRGQLPASHTGLDQLLGCLAQAPL
jgi:hypothetical protein